MSGQERGHLQRNAEQFQRLPEEERENLRRRAEAFSRLLEKALARMSDEERSGYDALSASSRRERERHLVRQMMDEENRDVLDDMAPPSIRENWGNLSPEERQRHQAEARDRKRRHDAALFLEGLVRKGHLSSEERDEVLSLDSRSRNRRLTKLRRAEDRRFLDRMVEREKIGAAERKEIFRLTGFDRRAAIDELRKEDFMEVHHEFLEGLSEELRDRLTLEPPPSFFRMVRHLYIDQHRRWFRGLPEGERRHLMKVPAPRFLHEVERLRREGN